MNEDETGLSYLSALVDSVIDKTGENESKIREAIKKLEEILKGMLDDCPEFTTGEISLTYELLFPPSVLAWFTAVLLRDRIEFGV